MFDLVTSPWTERRLCRWRDMVVPLCAAAVVSTLGACGAAETAVAHGAGATRAGSAVVDPTKATGEAAYNQRCYSLTARQSQFAGSGNYVPSELKLRWRAGSTVDQNTPPYTEETLVAALRDGTLTTAVVIARGGTGKTTLSQAIEASLCAEMRVVRLRLLEDVITTEVAAGTNAVLAAAAARLGAVGGDPAAAIAGALGNKPWLLLLDGMDEVPLGRRGDMTAAIDEAIAKLPTLSLLVFSRPPVYETRCGLERIGAVLTMPPVECAAIDAHVAATMAESDGEAGFRAFVRTAGLDRRLAGSGRCVYAHMSTWRDLGVVKHLARLAAKRGGTLAVDGDTRSAVYGLYLSALMRDDFEGQDIGSSDALALVDRMLAGRPIAAVQSAVMKLSDCETALGDRGEIERRATCERILQSSVFRTGEEPGTWRFANATLGDFFLARRMQTELRGNNDCATVERHSALLESSEVATFVAGLPIGQRCLGRLTAALCKRAAAPESLLRLLDQGLPSGAGRKELVATARTQLGESPSPCALQVLDGIAATPAATPAARPSGR